MLFTSFSKIPDLTLLPKETKALELRLDLFEELDLEKLHLFVKICPYPVLFTLKSKQHGGNFTQTHQEDLIKKLLDLAPAFFDLEYDLQPDFLQQTLLSYPHTKFILSAHFLQKAPSLETVYSFMATFKGGYAYKIAITPSSATEALQGLLFAQKHPKLSLICMGEIGEFARLISLRNRALLHYTYLSSATAEGQIEFHQLLHLYRALQLSPSTLLYGLIGHPVKNSKGHLYHNQLFQKQNIDAIYLKLAVKKEELPTFFPLAKELGFQGFSVTSPLKEQIAPFLQEIDPKWEKTKTINTLFLQEKGWAGTNTDGSGALDAVEKRGQVANKTILILGNGGSALAVGVEAKKRGAHLLFASRSFEKAKKIAHLLKGQALAMPDNLFICDIVISCCSTLDAIPFTLHPSTLVMDIVYHPKETLLLQKAKSFGCEIIYGDEMFYNQANAQNALWVAFKTGNTHSCAL